MTNIYRQAKNLLDKREAGGELSWEEFQLIKTAELALILRGCPLPEDMPEGECLEKLAQLVERANKTEKPRTQERATRREKPRSNERAMELKKPKGQERAKVVK